MKSETIAIHAGNTVKPITGDVTMPIHLSSTFYRGEDGGYPGGHMYTRISNPNRVALEQVITQLEKGADTMAFSSGIKAR